MRRMVLVFQKDIYEVLDVGKIKYREPLHKPYSIRSQSISMKGANINVSGVYVHKYKLFYIDVIEDTDDNLCLAKQQDCASRRWFEFLMPEVSRRCTDNGRLGLPPRSYRKSSIYS